MKEETERALIKAFCRYTPLAIMMMFALAFKDIGIILMIWSVPIYLLGLIFGEVTGSK